MKIYFIGSISGRAQYEENYKKIVEIFEKLDVEVLNESVLDIDFKQIEDVSFEEEAEYYEQVNDWINQADVVLAEVSHQSTSVGHEITLALSKNKPVVAISAKEEYPIIFKGIKNDRLQLIKYALDNLEKKLSAALKTASEVQDTRFNFFISPQHQNYLDWIAKNRKIPRSVFLRRLIDEHMKKNKDYGG